MHRRRCHQPRRWLFLSPSRLLFLLSPSRFFLFSTRGLSPSLKLTALSLSLSPRLGQGHVMAVGFGGRLWVMEVVGMVGDLAVGLGLWILAVGFGCGRMPCDCRFVVVLYEWVGDDSVCIVEWWWMLWFWNWWWRGVVVLYCFQLFAENGSVCVCVQLCPVNAGVRVMVVLWKCEIQVYVCEWFCDQITILYCCCCHVCSFDSFPIFVCACVFSWKNPTIENNVRTVCLEQQMKIPRN